MEFHVITRGSGWAAVLGEKPVRLDTGDIVMFPHGDAHVMSSAPGLRPEKIDVEWVHATRADPKPIPVSYLGTAEGTPDAPAPDAVTTLVCGFLGCDLKPFNPLIATLPRLLHLPSAGDGAWVAQVMQQAVNTSQVKRPGGEALLERMSEMMFVDAVRRYVEVLPEQVIDPRQSIHDRRAFW